MYYALGVQPSKEGLSVYGAKCWICSSYGHVIVIYSTPVVLSSI